MARPPMAPVRRCRPGRRPSTMVSSWTTNLGGTVRTRVEALRTSGTGRVGVTTTLRSTGGSMKSAVTISSWDGGVVTSGVDVSGESGSRGLDSQVARWSFTMSSLNSTRPCLAAFSSSCRTISGRESASNCEPSGVVRIFVTRVVNGTPARGGTEGKLRFQDYKFTKVRFLPSWSDSFFKIFMIVGNMIFAGCLDAGS